MQYSSLNQLSHFEVESAMLELGFLLLSITLLLHSIGWNFIDSHQQVK